MVKSVAELGHDKRGAGDPHKRAAVGAADPERGSSCVVTAGLLQPLLSADLPRPPEQAQVEVTGDIVITT